MLSTCYLLVIYLLSTYYLHVIYMLSTCYYMLSTCYLHVIYMLSTCYLHVIYMLLHVIYMLLHVIYMLSTCYHKQWNSGGYRIAEKYEQKFSYVCPVWLQLRIAGEQLKLEGVQDVNIGRRAPARSCLRQQIVYSDSAKLYIVLGYDGTSI